MRRPRIRPNSGNSGAPNFGKPSGKTARDREDPATGGVRTNRGGIEQPGRMEGCRQGVGHRCPNHLSWLCQPRHRSRRRARPSVRRDCNRGYDSHLSKGFGLDRRAVRFDGSDLHRQGAKSDCQPRCLPTDSTRRLSSRCALRSRLRPRPVPRYQQR